MANCQIGGDHSYSLSYSAVDFMTAPKSWSEISPSPSVSNSSIIACASGRASELERGGGGVRVHVASQGQAELRRFEAFVRRGAEEGTRGLQAAQQPAGTEHAHLQLVIRQILTELFGDPSHVAQRDAPRGILCRRRAGRPS